MRKAGKVMQVTVLVVGFIATTNADEILGRWGHPNWPLQGKGSTMEMRESESQVVLEYQFYDGSSYEEHLEEVAPKSGEIRRWTVRESQFKRANAILPSGVLRAEDEDGEIFRAQPSGSIAALDGAPAGQGSKAPAEPAWEIEYKTDNLTGKRTGHDRRADWNGWRFFCYESEDRAGCMVESPPGRLENGTAAGVMRLQMWCNRGGEGINLDAMGEGFPDFRDAYERTLTINSWGKHRDSTLRIADNGGRVRQLDTRVTWGRPEVWGKAWQRFRLGDKTFPVEAMLALIQRSRNIRIEFGLLDLVVLSGDQRVSPVYAFDLTGSAHATKTALRQPECNSQ